MLDTLVMKRSILNEYLEAKHLSLFYCMLAEKQLTREPQMFNIQRLSCCMKYAPEGEPIVVQPMKDERDFVAPERRIEDVEVPIAGISPELWLRAEEDGNADKILQLLSKYDDMIKEKREQKGEGE